VRLSLPDLKPASQRESRGCDFSCPDYFPSTARLSDNKMCLREEINITSVSISFRLLSFIKEYHCVSRYFTPLLISAGFLMRYSGKN